MITFPPLTLQTRGRLYPYSALPEDTLERNWARRERLGLQGPPFFVVRIGDDFHTFGPLEVRRVLRGDT